MRAQGWVVNCSSGPTAADAKKLGSMKVPAYFVGIDVLSGVAYIQHVPAGARKGFVGISTRRSLNCRAIGGFGMTSKTSGSRGQ